MMTIDDLHREDPDDLNHFLSGMHIEDKRTEELQSVVAQIDSLLAHLRDLLR